MNIAVLDDYQRVASGLADWGRLDGDVAFFADVTTDRAALVNRLAGFDVIVAMRERTPFPADLLAALPNLRLLVTTGSRNSAIDLEAARDHGVTVCGTESLPWATPELTFSFIHMLQRQVWDEIQSVRDGGWQVGLGRELHGSTLGIIGLGRLGSRVATIAQAYGMEVIAWSQNLTAERCAEVGVEHVTKPALLARSDVVTIHLKLGDRSVGIIGADDLAQMKPTAYLINTSRGPMVDTDALLHAVKGGVIAGAGIDVYDIEPLPADHPLRSEPRVLTTPHIGYVTEQTYKVFYPQAVDAIEAWAAGEPIRVLT